MDIHQATGHTLERICSDPELEAAWLATVARLEYMGARKIFRTVAARYPSPDVLEHLAHEVGHAHIFSALAAERGATSALDETSGVVWFQAVDQAVERTVDTCTLPADQKLTLKYLGTTALIERRAMSVYPLFRARTQDAGVRDALDRVIREEAAHRRPIEQEAMRRWTDAGLSFEALFALEERAFAQWLAALMAASAPRIPCAETATAPSA